MKLTSDGNYIYMIIPKEFYYIYRELLIKLSDLGIDIIKDCSSGCKTTNKQLYNCWILFHSACATYQKGDIDSVTKATFMFNYIKKQLNIPYVDFDDAVGDKSGEIKLTETKGIIGYEGGVVRIEFETVGNVGTIVAKDSAHGMFEYSYGNKYIDVIAKEYNPSSKEEFDIVLKGTNSGYCVFTIVRLPKEEPYVKFKFNEITRDFEGYDEDGNESPMEYEVSGNVGNITLYSDVDWINSPGDYVPGDEHIYPLILQVNDSVEERIGHIYIKTSEGYSDTATIIQKGKTVIVKTGCRDINISESPITLEEINSAPDIKMTKNIYLLCNKENAKCKWWSIPQGVKVVNIYDDLNEDNLQFAKTTNVEGSTDTIYYLYSPIKSTTNYTVIIKYERSY